MGINPLTTKYPDTAQGAKDCLKMLADRPTYNRFSKMEWVPDPVVKGVWAALDKNRKVQCIVYMAGHPDPFGNDRAMNDFESV